MDRLAEVDAVDRNGLPIAVPQVIPETEDEKRRYEAAQARRKRRLEERSAEQQGRDALDAAPARA